MMNKKDGRKNKRGSFLLPKETFFRLRFKVWSVGRGGDCDMMLIKNRQEFLFDLLKKKEEEEWGNKNIKNNNNKKKEIKQGKKEERKMKPALPL